MWLKGVEMATAVKGKVVFKDERCKACGLCIEVCPTHILALSDNINQNGYHPAYCVNMDQCIACKSCATICPDNVITVYRL